MEQLEASLAKAIATWGANSRNLATLYSQLDNLYAQRVRSGKSVERERELELAQDYLDRPALIPIAKLLSTATSLSSPGDCSDRRLIKISRMG